MATDLLGQQLARGRVVATRLKEDRVADNHRVLHVASVIVIRPVVRRLPQALPIRRTEGVEVVFARGR